MSSVKMPHIEYTDHSTHPSVRSRILKRDAYPTGSKKYITHFGANKTSNFKIGLVATAILGAGYAFFMSVKSRFRATSLSTFALCGVLLSAIFEKIFPTKKVTRTGLLVEYVNELYRAKKDKKKVSEIIDNPDEIILSTQFQYYDVGFGVIKVNRVDMHRVTPSRQGHLVSQFLSYKHSKVSDVNGVLFFLMDPMSEDWDANIFFIPDDNRTIDHTSLKRVTDFSDTSDLVAPIPIPESRNETPLYCFVDSASQKPQVLSREHIDQIEKGQMLGGLFTIQQRDDYEEC